MSKIKLTLLLAVTAFSTAMAEEKSFVKVAHCELLDQVNPGSKTYADIFLSPDVPEGVLVVGSAESGNFSAIPVSFKASEDFSTIKISKKDKFSFVIRKGEKVPVEKITGASFVNEGSLCTSSWGE
jgi:hypothetical protein